jgi:folate-dependent phosphoribosylglycinamide formyltransferase PurN
MSKYRFVREVKRELKQLNADIDLLIIKGRSYRHLAQRHKFLTKELRSLNSRSIIMPGFMRKLGGLVSTFMF